MSATPPAEHSADHGNGNRSRSTTWIPIAIAAAVPASLYLVFIAHFGRNGIYWDDWTFVPIVDGVIHHHLSFTELWQQHNENRMLFPLLLVGVVGSLTHLDTMVIMWVSAGLFIVSFALLLDAHRAYSNHWMTPLQTLFVGCVWFSIVDTENALWAFQVAWYLVLFCLMFMLFALGRRRLTPRWFCLAALIALVASFSSLQGLMLWPVGLLCIVWRLRDMRSRSMACGTWILVSLAAFAAYFHDFSFSSSAIGGGSSSYALHHPVQVGQYALALVGNVFPTMNPDVGLHELIGLALIVCSLSVVVASIRSYGRTRTLPLPAALIVFALLFDLSIALGRMSLGIVHAFSPRYTMVNLLILVALSAFVFARASLRPVHRRRRLPTALGSAAVAGVVCLLAVQIVDATDVGLHAASTWRQRITTGDTIFVNLDRIPEPARTNLFDGFVFPSLAALTDAGWLQMVQQDHLGELDPSTAAGYVSAHPSLP